MQSDHFSTRISLFVNVEALPTFSNFMANNPSLGKLLFSAVGKQTKKFGCICVAVFFGYFSLLIIIIMTMITFIIMMSMIMTITMIMNVK